MKLYDEFEHSIFNDYNLTDLMVLEEFPKRKPKISNDSKVMSLLQEYLKDFGIYLFGKTLFRKEQDDSESGIWVRYCRIDVHRIPIKNLKILSLLYGYKNVIIDISLFTCDSYNHSFDFNTNTGVCLLKENVYGSSKPIKDFQNINELVVYYRNNYPI